MPYEVFERLPEDRKERILQACMEVFAEKGYEGSSTNDIVKKAGISKGILFHYFGSKRNLFLYLLDETLDRTVAKFQSEYAGAVPDLFERILLSGRIKLKISIEEPLIQRILFLAFVHPAKEMKEELRQRYDRLYQIGIPMLKEGLDLSMLRDGIDPDRAVEIAVLCMEGLQNKYINLFQKMGPEEAMRLTDQIAAESAAFIDILKNGIYRY